VVKKYLVNFITKRPYYYYANVFHFYLWSIPLTCQHISAHATYKDTVSDSYTVHTK